MHTVKTIMVEREDMGNNETMILKGIYLQSDGSYSWLTSARSGNCKKLTTALKKVNLCDE